MKQSLFTILENRKLAKDVYRMILEGDTGDIKAPGQFVNIVLDGFYLRRPMSVCDWKPGELTLIYKVVGRGTAYMAGLLPGARLDLLTGLGNGFDLEKSGAAPVLVGGGAGVPPLYALAKGLLARGRRVSAVLGFNSAEDAFYLQEFEALGVQTAVTTVDGSLGERGLVTDALRLISADYLYTCGPEAMLRALYETTDLPGQFSFEERMACGFGACMGCSCETKYGSKRICRDGPVLEREEILW